MKGSKSGSKKQQAPYVAPDSAASISRANIVYGLAEGEIAGLANGYNSIYLDGTPIENNTGVPNLEGITIDFRKGTNDQEPMLGFPNLVNQIDYNNVEITTEKPFIHHINDTQYTTAAVRVTFGALFRTNATTGETLGNTIEYAIDVQVDGNGFAEYSRYVVSDKTSANYERRHEITLPEADQSWDIRVRRITPNQNSQYIGDKMYATSVAQIINAQYVYPNTSVLGVKYDASRFSSIAKLAVRLKGKIIRIPANLNPETGEYATRGQGTTNGTWNGEFKWAYSNNPAWVYYDLCLSVRYGLGNRIKQKMIDKFTLYTVGKYCDQKVPDGYGGLEKRFTVNVYIQSYFEAFELLSQLAGVFRGIIYYNGLSIKMEIDRPRDPVYTYNRTNTIGGFAYKGTKDKDRYSVITAEYDEPSLDFKTQPVTVFSKQAMQELGVRRKTIQCFGCTSRGQAQRAAYWALYKNIYETRLVTFRVGLDGFIAPTGRIIEVADPKFAGRANSGRVAEVSSDQRVIKLDVECGEVGDRIVVNGDDGISQSREILGISGSTITVSSPFDGISAEAAFAVESDDLNTLKFTVVSVTQDTGNDTPSFTITAVQHEPQIFDAAENDVFIEPPPVSIINPEVQEPVSNVTVMSETKVVQGISITNLIVVWDQVVGAVKYDIRWKKDSGQWINAPNNYSNTLIVEDVYTGDYVAEVVAISATDLRSVPKQSNITHIVARYVEPPPLATISAKGILFGVEISFNFLAGSENAEYTEIRVSELNDHSDAKTLTFVPYPKKDFTYSGLQGGKTFYYQARIVDRNGYPGPWSAWVYATVDANPDLILDLIEGELSEGMLDQELRGKISAANTNAQEALNTANQVKGETAQSISDLNANLDTERSERIANVSTLTNGVTTAQTTADGAISQLNNYKSSNDTALANMQTQINTAVDNSSAAVSKVDALDGRVQAAETNSASALSKANITINDVSALSQTVQQNTAAIGNKADTTYVNSVKSTAEAADGKASANTTAIQGLQARVGNNESTINNIQQTKANKDEVASIAQTALQSTWQNDAQTRVNDAVNWNVVTATGQDLNNYKTQGQWFFKITPVTNSPTTDWFYLQVDVAQGDRITQTVWSDQLPATGQSRRVWTGTWGNWGKIASMTDVTNLSSNIANTYQTKSDAISTTANLVTELQSYTQNTVNDLKVGGVNLITGTQIFDTSGNLKPNYSGFGNHWDGFKLQGKFEVMLANSDWHGFAFTGFYQNRLEQDCILSFWASVQDNGTISVGAYTNVPAINLGVISGAEWKRYSFKLPKGTQVFNGEGAGGTGYGNGVVEFSGFRQGTVVAYAGIQLQVGNKATDWTPSPLDTKVGGRNLLRNSEFKNGMDYWSIYDSLYLLQDDVIENSATKYIYLHGGSGGLYMKPENIPYVAKEGDMMTLSFYARGNAKMLVGFDDIAQDVQITRNGDAWTRYSVTLRRNRSDNVIMYVRDMDGSGTYVDLAKPKLELGTVASDWSPAPEDGVRALSDFQATVVNTYSTKTDTQTAVANGISQYSASIGQIATYKIGSCGAGQGWAGVRNSLNEYMYYTPRSYMVTLFKNGAVLNNWGYDVYGTDWGAQAVADRINEADNDTWIVITTNDEPRDGRNANMRDALISIGGTGAAFDNMQYRGAYMLIGRKGLLEGGGLEFINNGAQLEYSLQFVNGTPNGISGQRGNLLQGQANANAINQTNVKVSNLNGQVQSVASQTSTLTSSVNNMQASGDIYNTLVDIDLTAGRFAQNIWYPVAIPISARRNKLRVYALLDGRSHPSWATHGGGFTLDVAWEVSASQWGVVDPNRIVTSFTNSWANAAPAIRLGQLEATSREIIWLRGGGKYYASVPNSIILPDANGNQVDPSDGSTVYASAYTDQYIPKDINNRTNTNTVTLQQQAQVQNGILGIYAIKIDNNGVMSGFGLISELINGQVRSQFGVNADTFFIGNPANGKKPFVVLTSPGIINGVSVPAGTYIDSAYIPDATITSAKIADASITTAKIANASITTAKIGVAEIDTLRIQGRAVTVPYYYTDTNPVSIDSRFGDFPVSSNGSRIVPVVSAFSAYGFTPYAEVFIVCDVGILMSGLYNSANGEAVSVRLLQGYYDTASGNTPNAKRIDRANTITYYDDPSSPNVGTRWEVTNKSCGAFSRKMTADAYGNIALSLWVSSEGSVRNSTRLIVKPETEITWYVQELKR